MVSTHATFWDGFNITSYNIMVADDLASKRDRTSAISCLVRMISKRLAHTMMTSSNGNIFCVTGHLRGLHRSPVNSPHKGQWRRALMFSLICVWLNGRVNNRKAGDLRRYCAHYDVIVMHLTKYTHAFVCEQLYNLRAIYLLIFFKDASLTDPDSASLQ